MHAHLLQFFILLIAVILFGAASAITPTWAGRLVPAGLCLLSLYFLLKLAGVG